MKYFKIVKLIWTFYKSFIFFSFLVTALCIALFWEYGLGIYGILFCFKIATLTMTFFIVNSYKSNEYCYYQNLGVSKILLWVCSLSFDLILFFLFDIFDLQNKMTHILEADSIQFGFEGRRILSDIYLKCETGKITGILGRNGQGKSCLMKIIYGSLKCEKSVRIDNYSQYKVFKKRELLLYVPQFNFIPRSLTLKQIFQDFELEYSFFQNIFSEFKTRYKSVVNSLSGGEQRLIEVYLIVKSKTQFAILDEPFTHLNPLQIEKVKDVLIQEKSNKGLLITDHMFRNVTDISDTLYILKDGKTHLTMSINDIEAYGYARL